jgi:putative ABC transport system ATP-binding protein
MAGPVRLACAAGVVRPPRNDRQALKPGVGRCGFEAVNSGRSEAHPAVSLLLKDVRKSYREPDGRPLPVLNIAHFELKPAEQVALVGESGGGKTTLLNVVSGITAADAGLVRVDGVDITRLHEVARDRFRAERIGIVFQTFNLLPAFTALENVLLGMTFSGKANRQYARELLEHVGLGRRLHHKPGQLSVGEQQRVSVARALANRPKLMLADEPTASVDLAHQETILTLLRNACAENNVSLLLVTHSRDVSSQFDRVEELTTFNRPEAAA